jgi:heme-degrading monooxygenase HmoA
MARMHVSLTTTRGSPEEPIEIATIAGEEMLPWLRQVEGFEGLLLLSNQEEGTTLVLVFWESQEVADRHRTARLGLRDRVTAAANVDVVDTVGYEISFAHFGAGMNELSG